ncbi:MAG: bifunctional phosphoglucose/phosphomannose isomerase [Candidatus Rokuibacteriota bacterium]
MTLDDAAALARIDAHDTRTVLTDFPAQCRAAVGLALVPGGALPRPRTVIVAGMGGSAAGGDLLAACAAERLDIPVLVHRGYGLPALAGSADLVIALSYSGETVETLSAATTGLERGCRVVAITAGGRLAALARNHRLASVALPGGLMPRMAFGYLFFPALAVLRAAGLMVVEDAEVEEALGGLEALTHELIPASPAPANEAKRLALALGSRLPVIYGGPVTGPAAYRWKTDVEENAKLFAVAGVLPEMNHNEIESWGKPGSQALHVVLLRDAREPAEISRRFTLVRDLIAPSTGVSEAWTRGTGILARLLSLIALGQWTSFYLAALHGLDPWAVPVLEAFKTRLAEPSR